MSPIDNWNIVVIYAPPVNDEDEFPTPTGAQPDEDYWSVWIIQPYVNNVTLFS